MSKKEPNSDVESKVAEQLSEASTETTGQAPASWRLRILATLFVLGLCAVGLVVVEIGLRFTNIGKVSQVMSVGDPELGFGPQLANTRAQNYFPEYKNGYVMMVTNNRQFMEDKPTAERKAPGTTRVLIFGDSQTACGCENPESYSNQAESRINKQLGVAEGQPGSYEIVNGGVGRYSPYQYYVRAKLFGLPLKPDHIIFGIYLGNDLLDSGRNDDRPYLVKQADGSFLEKRPEYIVFQDPELAGHWFYGSRILNLLRDALGYNLVYQYSRFQMLRKNIESTGSGSLGDVTKYMKDIFQLTSLSRNMVTQAVNQHHWFLSFPQMKKKDLEIQREILRRAKQDFAAAGVKFSVIMIPAKVQIEPELIKDVFAKMNSYDPRLTEDSIKGFLDEYAAALLQFGKELDIEVLDPRQALLDGKKNRELYYREDMHLNVAGNEILGQFLAERLYAERAKGTSDTLTAASAGPSMAGQPASGNSQGLPGKGH